jgi:hypothetical protein
LVRDVQLAAFGEKRAVPREPRRKAAIEGVDACESMSDEARKHE